MLNVTAIGLYMVLTSVTGINGPVLTPDINTDTQVQIPQEKTKSLIEKKITTEEYVRNYFSDTPILAEVARCESTFRQTDKGGKVLRGEVDRNDVGIMQINERYHLEKAKELGYDIYTLEGNMAYAKEVLYKKQGTKAWLASSPCWTKAPKDLAMR